MQISLEGKRALVTGGTRGIGREISLALHRAGATVMAVYRSDEDAARKLSVEPGWAGGGNICARADLRDEAEVRGLAERFHDRVGDVDILVNNVGSYRRIPFGELTEADWRESLDDNLTLAYLVTRHFLPHAAEGASIVNVGVAMALRGQPLHSHYTASKAGLIGLTRSLCKELGGRSIRVNTVAPGIVETDSGVGVPPEQRDRLRGMTALGRFGTAEEIARVVLFLASDLGAYVNGTTINVDGGI